MRIVGAAIVSSLPRQWTE